MLLVLIECITNSYIAKKTLIVLSNITYTVALATYGIVPTWLKLLNFLTQQHKK